MKRIPLLVPFLFLGATAGLPQEAALPSLESLYDEIEKLRVPDVAWRRISWRSCLLEGLQESQRTKKPLMLWVFIDRPIDDMRC